MRIETAGVSPRPYHHLKFVDLEARRPPRRPTDVRVWTGSDNWWGPSQGNDERYDLTDETGA